MNKEVTIIILCHKSKDLVINYIKSIFNKFEIIIIDNSNDIELIKIIQEHYPGVIIKNIDNDGYGAAINYGSKLVKTKYFLISNPDLSGINENSLNEFVNTAKFLKDEFSVLGPRYLDVNPKSLIQSNEATNLGEINVLSGACMFFKKEVFDFVGGFDENFFLYFEENDFCLKAIKFKKIYQINKIKILHNAGNSVLLKNQEEIEDQRNLRSWHFVWSKFYFYKKNYSFIYALIIFIPIILRTRLKIIYYSIINNSKNLAKYANRWEGMKTSILGKKSFKRPNF
jgi:N-acetylglucosaminyl-diphospho-decaprenol L-rhamnosyltransferase